MIAEKVAEILKELGISLDDPNFRETPQRIERMLRDLIWDEEKIEAELESYKRAVFPSRVDEMVVVKDICAYSLCPHHLLPVEYQVDIAYLSVNSNVIGLSKLGRVVSVIAKRPLLQEDYVVRVKDALVKLLDNENVAVRVLGRHLCMIARGIKQRNSYVETISLGGKFLDAGVKQEFLNAVRR